MKLRAEADELRGTTQRKEKLKNLFTSLSEGAKSLSAGMDTRRPTKKNKHRKQPDFDPFSWAR